ncbi:hypothetical protein [Promicromonospora iranensis]|uniref:SH3 domain-containing protein n=1 Tax=Promicromonospora iranensis TaxID=1105144 RepID=A0ABU2CJL7_9MICO|nr:hypothetical protein [Promicromonospora iranensis]MDR7381525.1 hypothetical protein [Promicromonospora iranensis]
MLTQVRKTRRSAALLAATTCALVIASGTAVAAVGHATGSGNGSGPGPAAQAWSVDLTARTDDDAGVRHADGALRLDTAGDTGPGSGSGAHQETSGQLVAEPTDLDSPASVVAADVDATAPAGTSVLIDVRGRLADQGPDSWTEWVPAGSPLPAPSETVQARVTLLGEDGTSPAVREVTLTPEAPRAQSLQEAELEAAPTAAADTYRVFATREGLVGGTTANGHVITSRDHFVALPSRRGLSSKSSGSYSVRVCAERTGRCAYAPVWDVGPWNTTDDYWNDAGTRQSWADLPQGRPQAQAAHQDGYNGGLDGFGRRVANPAGIDLGDGTFWDGVGLTDNAWTTVTYLWTGSGPKGVVRTSGGPLTVRSGPGTGKAAVGQAGNHANVVIECTARGTTVTGTYGTTDLWNRIGPGNWVSDAYVNTGSSSPVAPAC